MKKVYLGSKDRAEPQKFKIALQKLIRRDIAPYLMHWTKSRYERNVPNFPAKIKTITAFEILIEILKDMKLKGSCTFIKGGYNCVCFTEAPLMEMVSIFNFSNNLSEKKFLNYDPFGIGFSKKTIYDKGGRPVIYQSDEEYADLPESIKWRHQCFNPLENIDFTWEREWRIKVDELPLETKEIAIVVPNSIYAQRIIENEEIDETLKKRIYRLDIFGLIYKD